jgi:hypothetical protein
LHLGVFNVRPEALIPGRFVEIPSRQKGAAFDIDETGCHREPFTRKGNIHFLTCLDESQVFTTDWRDGKVADVQLPGPDKMEQQVKWSFKGRQLKNVLFQAFITLTLNQSSSSFPKAMLSLSRCRVKREMNDIGCYSD